MQRLKCFNFPAERTVPASAMPPRLPLIAAGRRGPWRAIANGPTKNSLCSICYAAARNRPQSRRPAEVSRPNRLSSRRKESTLATESTPAGTIDEIPDLKEALLDLQKHYRSYVNISRLQLALRGLEQTPGDETIRIGIFGLAGNATTSASVRQLVRVLVADPLKEEEEWEKSLTALEAGKPLLLRIENGHGGAGHPTIQNRLLQEVAISSPTLSSHRLELLVLDTDLIPQDLSSQNGSLAEGILVPTVDIPIASGRYSPITTPVHKAIVLGDGILGAASLLNIPLDVHADSILPAANIPGFARGVSQEVPVKLIDIDLAEDALATFRQSLDNAIKYEQEWFESGVPELLDFIKAGTQEATDGSRKAPLLALIRSILEDGLAKVQYEESQRLAALLTSRVSSPEQSSLQKDLKTWAERAHTELREQLDIAFAGRRWRKLGWWKLFWRVDDVSMLTFDILQQRFLTEAEKELIFLAGQIHQAGIFKAKVESNGPPAHWAFQEIPDHRPSDTVAVGSLQGPLKFKSLMDTPQDDGSPAIKPHPWPMSIPTTRTLLATETVPALQALAQKLVFQTLSTSSFASIFGGLIYVSTLSASLYEAGAFAALGIVWSLRNMQKKWEAARSFWEQEVREEGRKAVRSVEGVVGHVLAEPDRSTVEGAEELKEARKAFEKAQRALEALPGARDVKYEK